MKKIKFLLLATIAAVSVSILFISCIDEDIIQTVNIDFNGFAPFNTTENVVTSIAVALVNERTGVDYQSGTVLLSTRSINKDGKFTVILPDSLNYLKNKTKEVLFLIEYTSSTKTYYYASIIKKIHFLEKETNITNIGFENYDWFTHPKLYAVVVETDERGYYPN